MNNYTELTYDNEEQWHKIRSTGIGGSDIATILNLNEYKTSHQLWLEKTGRVIAEDISQKEAIIRGKTCEPILFDLFKAKYKQYDVTKLDKTLKSKKYDFMLANLDGVLTDQNGNLGVFEIKTAKIQRHDKYYDVWIEKDDKGYYTVNQVPLNYYLQVQHYLAVTGWEYAILFADLELAWQDGKSVQQVCYIPRDEVDIKEITKKCIEFYSYVKNDVEPPIIKNI